jgi:sarcosine oxidase subunit alpha
MEAAPALDVTPYGTEALGVMRIEKGTRDRERVEWHDDGGRRRDGRMMSKKKDFIGRVLAGRPGLTDSKRPCSSE